MHREEQGSDFLNPDRLFPQGPALSIARELYESVANLPIVSPHGHTDPAWFAENRPFTDAAALFLTPDHYVLRMLQSQGISYDRLGVPRKDGRPVAEGREAWRLFAANYHLFAGTPSRMWIDHSLNFAFGLTEPLSAQNADALYDLINKRLADPDLLPLAVLDRANVEVIATTEFALDPLTHHRALKEKGLIGRIRTTYRPDDVTDPDVPGFRENIVRLAEITGEDTARWEGLIEAHRKRRAAFREMGAVATDHGVPSAATADLPAADKQKLLDDALAGRLDAAGRELFRAQMLTEMAGLSAEDGMVMQIHAGSRRNTDPVLMAERGPNLGADIPMRTDFVNGLSPLLSRYGNAENFRLILFTLDESTYARELAPMAGYWSSLRIGPPWWFHDSSNGIRRYLDQVVETAGFYNLAGFNDDTRALLSIPARHDLWRREVCRFLALLVAEHRLSKASAREIAAYLSYQAAKDAYKL
ncbi:glucuronate isomerase [Chelativorans sp. SCAU2101]|jgi:Glucuronate isomerase|uniref:Uronate isomerase n=1 Tax=Chelativorans petroleitrophicus TaxID=2975484 RepID=A0A9X2X5V2_9HYPH|nr:glucuronate isomerase [Chelativorans petroleitrophicus]MCT8989395.1 glucuronate isomerase [Chelativorans petroleitrophicus]